MSFGQLVGNIVWLILGGITTAIGWLLIGVIFCCTIIGIPLGIQAFKMARLTLMPFGSQIVWNGSSVSMLANVIWFICGGFIMALYYFIVGLLYCLTIVGIPFGIQLFKMAQLSLAPFGAEVL
ncbi:YccF domain-containing protein [Atopobium fossor]|uniref:YccF domain-containing protein n=1 Tax=Atopobium fossor TaxID=39487 RepID=UPI0003FBC60E|nr:YccF domain-containing protein [Atopobium fossor]